jgi:hypothetical protein
MDRELLVIFQHSLILHFSLFFCYSMLDHLSLVKMLNSMKNLKNSEVLQMSKKILTITRLSESYLMLILILLEQVLTKVLLRKIIP